MSRFQVLVLLYAAAAALEVGGITTVFVELRLVRSEFDRLTRGLPIPTDRGADPMNTNAAVSVHGTALRLLFEGHPKVRAGGALALLLGVVVGLAANVIGAQT